MQEQQDLFPDTEESKGHENAIEETQIVVENNHLNVSSIQEDRKENYWSQFGLLIGMIGVGLITASLFSLLAVKLMIPHAKIFNLEKELFNPANASAMKVMQLGSTILMFFLPAFLFATISNKKPFTYLGFNKKISYQQILLVIFIACVAIIAGGLLSDLNEKIPISKHLQESFRKAEDEYKEQVMVIAKMNNIFDYLTALLIIALTPAIVEETFFRGTLQQLFIKWFGNSWIGILVTSIIFSAIHFSYYGFLTRVGLGIELGLLFYYSKNIWLNIFAHFLNNAIAVTILYGDKLQGKPLSKDALDDHFPIVLGVISFVILIYLIIRFKKASEVVLYQTTD